MLLRMGVFFLPPEDVGGACMFPYFITPEIKKGGKDESLSTLLN